MVAAKCYLLSYHYPWQVQYVEQAAWRVETCTCNYNVFGLEYTNSSRCAAPRLVVLGISSFGAAKALQLRLRVGSHPTQGNCGILGPPKCGQHGTQVNCTCECDTGWVTAAG